MHTSITKESFENECLFYEGSDVTPFCIYYC